MRQSIAGRPCQRKGRGEGGAPARPLSLKLPDAVQLATAIASGAYGLVTHDRDFSTVRELPILT